MFRAHFPYRLTTTHESRNSLLNLDAARKLATKARESGDSRVLKELLDTAGELRAAGLMSKEPLSHLVLNALTRPMTDTQVEEFIARRYTRWGNISLGGTRLRAATPEADRDAMQRDFDAGKREKPDIESDDDKA